ncbi:MAG: UDP-N-acetylglucosamine 2-epimerase (non-hydrolyzing), partial [Bacteroidales bacterium]|nr:UDP-N-acetylglucosamine 2-epimerase (non-hydrolyzing) [Bacteroidales bacterium]
GEQTAKMIAGIEEVLLNGEFDGVILYGDTNSTLAGAVAASKLHIPVFHVEAGLRSFNMSMPEEINRIVCDQLSSILFAPTDTAIRNLENEGFFKTKYLFPNGKGRLVYKSGDVMYDNSLHFGKMADQRSTILKDKGLERDKYVLMTLHRDNNTDNKDRLTSIFSSILDIVEKEKIKVIFPMHPRTSKMMKQILDRDIADAFVRSEYINIIPPVSFLDMIALEKNAKVVVTDSGGVQKESYFYGRPSIILRSETEWMEIVKNGAGILTDADNSRIMEAYKELTSKKTKYSKAFGDGNASKYIIAKILDYLL